MLIKLKKIFHLFKTKVSFWVLFLFNLLCFIYLFLSILKYHYYCYHIETKKMKIEYLLTYHVNNEILKVPKDGYHRTSGVVQLLGV